MHAIEWTPAAALAEASRTDEGARLILADHWDEQGRPDVAMLYRDQLPEPTGKRRKRVDKLTDQERAAFAGWVETWIKIGRCTEPADRPLFEAAVQACYRYANLTPPRVVWCESPIVAVMTGPLLHYTLNTGRGAQVDAQVHAQVRDQVHAQVRAQVRDQVRAQVGAQVDAQVHAQVRDQVRAQVGAQVGDQVGDRKNFNAPWLEWWRIFAGQFWVGWYWYGSPSVVSCFMDLLRLDLGPKIERRARAYMATSMSACWWWPHRDFVCVSERPAELRFDGNKLLLARWEGWQVRPK